MIVAKNLVKTYRNGEEPLYALNGIDLTIGDGEFAVILGESGSGKTTLLNALSGLEKPDSGSIAYDGEDICALEDKGLTAFRRRTVAFVFQQYYLLPALTAEENVRMGAYLSGAADVLSVMQALGLKGKEHCFPNQLSGGQQQRVAIARALVKRPKVLFCDEPTGALDAKTGEEVLALLRQLREQQGFTTVMVTHNAAIADTATRVLRMKSGSLVC